MLTAGTALAASTAVDADHGFAVGLLARLDVRALTGFGGHSGALDAQ